MDCSEVRLRIDADLDDTKLPLDSQLERHLKTCPACRRYAEQGERLVELLRELEIPPARPGAHEKSVSRMIRAIREAHPRRRRISRIAFAVATAALLLIGLGLWLVSGWPSRGDPVARDVAKSGLKTAPASESIANEMPVAPRRIEIRRAAGQDLDLLDKLTDLAIAVADAETKAEQLQVQHEMAAVLLSGLMRADRTRDQSTLNDLTTNYLRILRGITPLAARLWREGKIEAFDRDRLLADASDFVRGLEATDAFRGSPTSLAVNDAWSATRAYQIVLQGG